MELQEEQEVLEEEEALQFILLLMEQHLLGHIGNEYLQVEH